MLILDKGKNKISEKMFNNFYFGKKIYLIIEERIFLYFLLLK